MMKASSYILKQVLHFSRWCRKGYAVFAALGREVRISVLAISICVRSMLKSAKNGLIVTMAACWEMSGEEIVALREEVKYVLLEEKEKSLCKMSIFFHERVCLWHTFFYGLKR